MFYAALDSYSEAASILIISFQIFGNQKRGKGQNCKTAYKKGVFQVKVLSVVTPYKNIRISKKENPPLLIYT